MLTLIILLTLNSSFSCKSQEHKIKVLTIKDTQVFTLLNEVIRHEKIDTIKDGIYVIKITKGSLSHEFRIANFSKSLFSKYILGKKDSLRGIFKYQGYFVLVYGKSVPALFQETTKECSLNFFTKKSKKLRKESGVPEPPEVFEPTVWLYGYENKAITFKDVGYFNLLK